MGLSKGNRRWLWVIVLGLPLLCVASCAGLIGLGFLVDRLSPKLQPTPDELAIILHAEEVAQSLGHDAATPTLAVERVDVLGLLPKLDATSNAEPIRVETEAKLETNDRVDNHLSGARILVAMGVAEDMGPLPLVSLRHIWVVDQLDEGSGTVVAMIHGNKCIEWRITGAQIRDGDLVRTLLEDEMEAFQALPW